MKYFKKDNRVWAFESDNSQDHLITDEFIAMTQDEIDRHINPQNYLSDEEKALLKRQSLSKLSKRQFALYLFDHNMYDQVMQAIEANPRFKIEYDTVSDIERLSPTVTEMSKLLNWTDEQVDAMWSEALTL
ncbi:hypothetical protein [Acinetobacter sp. YH1901141]|uniref:hypothetical protein n=1 Tax=Acinetobacter sp. YH1901141 TaxID=2601201 RepID=UPI0015D17244|nr:hypothetical protein [Acinetobacter sp. YH1901141]